MIFKRKNAAVKVAKKELFDIYEKTFQNFKEDCKFSGVLADVAERQQFENRAIFLGCTPFSLGLGGANLRLKLTINPGTLYKCFCSADEKWHGHNLNVDTLGYLLQELRNPALLLKGSHPNTLVAVTGLRDNKNRPVIISVALNRIHQHHLTNQITSAYGRNSFNSYLKRQIEAGNLIAVNKNKANRMFQSAELQLPIEETLISFDDSISYKNINVNSFLKNNIKNFKFSVLDVPGTAGGEENRELKQLIKRFKKIVSRGEDIIEKLGFFDYASDEIYNSLLWYQYQQDKDYVEKHKAIVMLEDVVKDARATADKLEKQLPHNKNNKAFHL